LKHAEHYARAGCICKSGKLIERPLRLEPPGSSRDETHQRGVLAFL
jgi:hypothetical protein